MKITQKIIPGFPSYGSGISSLKPKYIVIHDTAGQSSASAEAIRVQKPSAYNNGVAHYYIDDKECYQVIKDNVKAWHCGDGYKGKGNGESIGIEVCKSLPGGNFKNN